MGGEGTGSNPSGEGGSKFKSKVAMYQPPPPHSSGCEQLRHFWHLRPCTLTLIACVCQRVFILVLWYIFLQIGKQRR